MASTATKYRVGIQLPNNVAAMLAIEPTAGGVQDALARFAHLVGEHAKQLDAVFDRSEWNMMADALNGCHNLMNLDDNSISSLSVITLEVSDAHLLNRTGDKWFPKGKAADKAVADLITKLEALTPLHAEAIGAAIRHFWQKGDIDHTVEEWWTLAHRSKYWGKSKESD